MTSVPSHYGYGLYYESGKGLYGHRNGSHGEGLFSGGGLLSRNGQLHPALLSDNPKHYRNKHLSIYATENSFGYL